MSKRGFITVATGKSFYRMAKNLAMSYRLFSDKKYPLAVITDKIGVKKLKPYFDEVVLLEAPNYSYLDKMMVYSLSPYEETVFIDADSNIVDDISFLFDEFLQNQAEVCCLGSLTDITQKNRPNHFGNAAIQKFGFTQYIRFNGGVYYYKKSPAADLFMKFIFDELIPNYYNYELTPFFGKKADEPLIGVAMLYFGMNPLDISTDVMKCIHNLDTLKWDLKAKKSSALWYGILVSPRIIHYGSGYNCSTWKYYYYNAKVVCKYKKIIPPFSGFVIVKNFIAWFINAISHNSYYRKDKINWIKAHFTKKYFLYLRDKFRKRKS